MGDQSNPGREIAGDLDSGSIGPSTGFWTWGTDGTDDTLAFTHTTDQRNMLTDLEHDFDGQSPSNITPVYDAAGNLTDDGTYLFQYDAWNRLVQVKLKSSGAMRRHYTYDGLGRLIKTTSPDNFSNRVEHHHYDGARRVQTVVLSGTPRRLCGCSGSGTHCTTTHPCSSGSLPFLNPRESGSPPTSVRTTPPPRASADHRGHEAPRVVGQGGGCPLRRSPQHDPELAEGCS